MQIGYVTGKGVAALFLVLMVFSCRETGKAREAHAFTNALIHETSPYLLQHAHNPVDWRPWSQEALEEAEETGKLVLVSIGYSSCHWCHVMEEETFEDPSVAALMNKDFINIKVDREERPDVDQVYMTALQLLTGSGGWPLNVITLPNGKPIYGGTYHTKEAWLTVLREISALYKEAPEKAEEYADKVAQGIRSANLIQPPSDDESLTREVLHSSVAFWKTKWDMELGGNQGTQKFMLPGSLDFLLDYAVLSGDTTATTFVKTTLDQMAGGGVYDQVGGGFFRYSTDPGWHIPHFEKMLYDNAQLIGLYSKAYTVFGDPMYQQLVREITIFLDREMKHPGGAYYAAMDADSEGEEGTYYIWTREELQQLMGEKFALFATYYDIRAGQEWEQGKFVLRRPVSDDRFITEHGLSREQLEAEKQRWQRQLLTKRQERPAPRIDDKIITSWNALLVKGWVEAYEAFGDQAFLDRALAVYGFLQQHNRDGEKLRHSYKENSKRIEGFLEDYAFLADAGLQLYSATGDPRYFEDSESLLATTETLFGDAASGMYRFKEDDELIAKIIKTDDGVLPSPNAVMAHNLFRMGHIGYLPESIKKSNEMLKAVTPYLQQSPDTYTKWGALFLHTVYPFYEVAVVGPDAFSLLRELKQVHLPNTLILASPEESNRPLFRNRYVPDETYIYVCQNHSCKLPVTSVEAAVDQLSYH